MLAKHHPLLWTFAGGCLSGAVLIGVVFVSFDRDAETIPDDAPRASSVERARQPTSAEPADDVASAAHVPDDASDVTDDALASPSRKKAELAGAPPPEEGSSIADILLRLEAAYRQELATPPAQEPPTQAATAIPQTTPEKVPAHDGPAVAVAAPPAPPTTARAVQEAPAHAEEIDEQPVRVAVRDEATTQNIYYGDVQQNSNVGRVQQGDVYVMPSVVPYAPYYAPNARRSYSAPAKDARSGVPRAVHFTNNPYAAGSGVFNYPVDGAFKYPVDWVH
jgi:hypothetical protein